jgi:hypothetical protein
MAQLVARHLAKVKAAGSNPVVRSEVRVPKERRRLASTQAQYLRRHCADPLATGSTRENPVQGRVA